MSSNKRARFSVDHTAATDNRSNINNAKPKPQLTRACAECKKHKIKCFVQPGQSACNKCLKGGIPCIPHNFAQKFIDEDAAWKTQTSATIERLKDAVDHLLHHNNLPDLTRYDGTISILRALSGGGRETHEQTSVQTLSPLTTDHSSSPAGPGTGDFTSEGPSAGLRGNHDDSDLVPLPMNNLYNLTDPNNSQLIRVDPADVNGPDFIAQGVLSVSEAESLFDHYRDHINPLLWDGMLCAHRTLSEARQSSSLLVAVVLTVAALHIPNREKSLRATYGAFVSLMRGSCLLRCHNLDVVRGLCIGAFYLTSLSWALCSRAVRLATEMNLHKSSLQFARGSPESHERVQLWYALYVVDHQFALAYGRPPMMHEDAAIRNADKLLTSGLSSRCDYGLVAQVKLFRILASGYFMYGCDPDLELAGQDFEKLQEFNVSVDQWRLENQSRDKVPARGEAQMAIPSSKTNSLYYHLARFQLNSVSLRGISAKDMTSLEAPSLGLSWDRQEASNVAITAAMGTARLIIDHLDLQRALIGLPIFTHAMIAVCGSFLLKMAVAFAEPNATDDRVLRLPRDLVQHGLNFHTKTALTTIRRLVSVLTEVADKASQRHVVRQVVTGLADQLQRFSPSGNAEYYTYSLPREGKDVPSIPGSSSKTCPPAVRVGHLPPEDSNPGNEVGETVEVQPDLSSGFLDPFDLTGDLDWRFDDGFLLGNDIGGSEVPYL
ncbi:hypothetical protein N3K66_004133 [Trichothecium roseum]|uniref:Uncharacterized protein n=1 Tax=Trichothecium roseum TaxID=47278 RepID=A0ACC0V332_9HYPO|nr:hypothetical protein N3K66_004133 [Trichothecium roseum]